MSCENGLGMYIFVKSVRYIPGRWSLKIKCGPWKSLKIVAFFCLNPVKGLCHDDTEFYIFLVKAYLNLQTSILSPLFSYLDFYKKDMK